MGRKRSSKGNGPHKLLPQSRTELTEMVDQLFQKCTKIPPANSSSLDDWEKYIQIHQLVERIREKEKEIVLPTYDREEQIEPFINWLHSKNVKMDGITISNYDNQGFGLISVRDLSEGECVLSIPKDVVMSEETARKSYLASLIEKDPILLHMGNVALSLHVLGEYVNPTSIWQPYLHILPAKFSTILYFTPDEVKCLKGSPLLDETIKQFHNIARQYSYFYRIFQSLPEARSWPIKDYFTFDNYRWAVSAVMTRLNRIPSHGTTGQLALIPLWDMANHEPGVFSTDFDETKDEITCFAQRNFKDKEQFRIYYGPRSNAEFFLHNAFVSPDNSNDSLSLKLGVSKSDSLVDAKAKLLSAISLSVSNTFQLIPGHNPIPPDLLGFTRIFCMDKESLDWWNNNLDKVNDLRREDCPTITSAVREKALNFLKTRVFLLQKAYPTQLEDDLASPEPREEKQSLIRALLIEEKKILRDAFAYLSSLLLKK